MITINTRSSSTADQHTGFLAILPIIQRQACMAFRHLPHADREDATAATVANAFSSYVRLTERGKKPAHFPAVLATRAAQRVRNGRQFGGRSTSRDVLAQIAQSQRGFRVRSLDTSVGEQTWQDALVDNTQTPVPNAAAFRI